jgi:outer membrane protein assembly factor BamB
MDIIPHALTSFPCNCALEEYDCCRRTKPVRPWPSDFGVESSFRDRKHIVFAVGTILRWCVYEVNMTSLTIVSARTSKQVCLLGTAILFLAGFCFSQPAISLSPTDGPPTTSLRVSGSGFAPNARVDIYFGTQDEALAVANGAGSFSQIAIPAPASALPGTHWVSAVERSSHTGAQATFLVSTSWSEFDRPDMKRWNPYENVLNVNNVGSLQLKWKHPTGYGVISSPAVVNGVVYFGATDMNGNLYALKASTGAKLWSAVTSKIVVSSPAVANGVVYVGSYDDNVYALNASTGAYLWLTDIGDLVVSSPTVANGVVYVGALTGCLSALNASTGGYVWGYCTNGVIASTPAVANGVVYVGSNDGNVYALNSSTGALLWSYPVGGGSSPLLANGVIYVGADNVYALNARTGAKLWSYATGVQSSLAVAKGVVYAGSGAGTVYALKASTGAKLWSYGTGGAISSPAVANGVVYVGSNDHNVYALNASTGALLWSYATGGMVESSPAVANGVVYFGSDDGNVYAFGLKKGRERSEAASERPSLKTLHPDFNLKVSQPVATPAGTR